MIVQLSRIYVPRPNAPEFDEWLEENRDKL
jgi:hypothetical protein